MTAPPTPEQKIMWLAVLAEMERVGLRGHVQLRECLIAYEALIAERTETCKMIDRRTTERDQALARVKELEAEPGSFASWVVERHRAEKAEAHVVVLREALKSIGDPPARVYSTDWQTETARAALAKIKETQ